MARNYSAVAAQAPHQQDAATPPVHPPVEGLTLFVSEINADMERENLFALLGGVGKIASLESSSIDQGIGMVTYFNAEDATQMLEELNFKELNDHKVLRVSRYSARDEEEVMRRKDVIVKNVPRTFTNDDLRSIFVTIGNIVDAKKSENHPEHGYVQFADAQSAQRAIVEFNDTAAGEKTIKVEKFMSIDEYNENNLHIANLSHSVTETDLRHMFEQFGAIRDLKIIENRGFGYVAFETKEAAVLAMERMHNTRPFADHPPLRVSKYIPKEQRRRTFVVQHQENPLNPHIANLYVGQLAATVTEDLLNQLFSNYGSIRSTKVMRDNMGQPRGFGFVNFHRPEDAMRAIEALHNKDLEGRRLRVSVQRRNHEDQLNQSMQRMQINPPTVYQTQYAPQYNLYQPYQQGGVTYGYAYAQPMQPQPQYVYSPYQQVPMQPINPAQQQYAQPPPPIAGPHMQHVAPPTAQQHMQQATSQYNQYSGHVHVGDQHLNGNEQYKHT